MKTSSLTLDNVPTGTVAHAEVVAKNLNKNLPKGLRAHGGFDERTDAAAVRVTSTTGKLFVTLRSPAFDWPPLLATVVGREVARKATKGLPC